MISDLNGSIQAFPLHWPGGWLRARLRERARFSKQVRSLDSQPRLDKVTVAEGLRRVLGELRRMDVPSWNVIVSTNVPVRNDGLPYSNAREPDDSGAAVYWRGKGDKQQCIAVDRYDRVADNLAAIAATLEAMRAIERHGGAEILDRAFTGFVALPAPEQPWQVLGLETSNPTREQVDRAYRELASRHHPDKGGDPAQMARINTARDDLHARLRGSV